MPPEHPIILLAEDEPLIRNMTAAILGLEGYNVLEATNGLKALELAEENRGKDIQLLLTDIDMPKLNGLELANRFKRIFPKTKILLMSGYIEETCLRDITSDSNVAFLGKPFLPHILTQKIQDMLDESFGQCESGDLLIPSAIGSTIPAVHSAS